MLGRYAKGGILVFALVVLVVEGFLVYRWYDRHQAPAADGVPGGATASAPAPEGTMPEGTAPEETTTDGDSPPGADGDAFAHRATDGNSRGDYTYLDDPRINGDPDAVVLASPTGPYERNVGVWYEPQERRWAIFNQDRARVPAGSAFGVAVPPADEGFVHRAGPEDTFGNVTYLDDPLPNGRPDAEVSVTQNWNPGGGEGVYNDHPVGALYDGGAGSWFVHNKDGARVPEGAAFNVSVSGGPDAMRGVLARTASWRRAPENLLRRKFGESPS